MNRRQRRGWIFGQKSLKLHCNTGPNQAYFTSNQNQILKLKTLYKIVDFRSEELFKVRFNHSLFVYFFLESQNNILLQFSVQNQQNNTG